MYPRSFLPPADHIPVRSRSSRIIFACFLSNAALSLAARSSSASNASFSRSGSTRDTYAIARVALDPCFLSIAAVNLLCVRESNVAGLNVIFVVNRRCAFINPCFRTYKNESASATGRSSHRRYSSPTTKCVVPSSHRT